MNPSSSNDLALATARIRQRFAACVAREIAGQIIARSTAAAEYVPTRQLVQAFFRPRS